MSWVVQSNKSATCAGECVPSVQASYACSYQKGSVCAGDKAELQLSQLGGITIEAIDVSVKSNKSGGAGTWTVTVNDVPVASQTGTFQEWTGAYDNTNYHVIHLINSPKENVRELVITLDGTANSLHIDRYTITYQPAPVRTVTLMNGADEYDKLTETQSGEGVTLPSLPDTPIWRFLGWSETEFWSVTEKPKIIPAGAFFPQEDARLWATYVYDETEDEVYVSQLESGRYLYVNRESGAAITGVPVEGRMSYELVDRTDEDQWYEVSLQPDNKAYLTHAKTQTPIGYSGTALDEKASLWSVYHEGDQTLFYTEYNNKTYVLWPQVYDPSTQDFYAGLLSVRLGESPMGLLAPAEGKEPVYTCHPETGVGIENVPADAAGDYILHLGTYELHVRKGQKYIQIQ